MNSNLARQPAVHGGASKPAGDLTFRVIKPLSFWSGTDRPFWDLLRLGLPRPFAHPEDRRTMPDVVAAWRWRNLPHLMRGAIRVGIARFFHLPVHYGALFIRVIRVDGSIEDYGLASLRLMTDNGMGFIVDAFQNSVEMENMKYHGLGTGTNAEAAGDSALQTELTTQYNPDSTRATGSTTEASQKVYRTVGTNTVDASAAVTEHGVLSQAATGGGVLFDRSVFTVVNLGSGDSFQSTYEATFNSGG